MEKRQLDAEKNRVGNAMALYAAEPEFDRRIAEEFMGWNLRPEMQATVPGHAPVQTFFWVDSAGQPVAGPEWSPMTNATHAIELMRSARWRRMWPHTALTFGPETKNDVIVIWEKEGGQLQELARAPRLPTAVSLAAIRSLTSAQQN